MIVTNLGMHVREVVAIDESRRTATVRGYGDPEKRAIEHQVRLDDLKADAGLAEVRNKLTAFLFKQEG